MKVIKCKQCDAELKGGFYNTPIGTFCPGCWEKKPKKVKDKALADTLKSLGVLGKMVSELSIQRM